MGDTLSVVFGTLFVQLHTQLMRKNGRVEHMGEMINADKVLVGKAEGKGHLEDLGVNG
jgi:hypothetical protein